MRADLRFPLILFTTWVVQATIVPSVAFGAVQPDLLLVVVVVSAVLRGPAFGAVAGFSAGLLQDLLAPGSIGVGALVKTAVGYSVGTIDRTLLGDNVLLPVALIALVSMGHQGAYLGVLFLSGEGIDFVTFALKIILPSAAYTAAVGLALFPVLGRWLGGNQAERSVELS